MIPFEKMPGIAPLFLAFARGRAGEFFPDPPTGEAVRRRARELLGAGAREVVVATGQQAGLLGGPLLTLTKALGAARLARELSRDGLPARAVFWVAAEDHDLGEVARATILVAGAPKTFALHDPAEKSFRPTGRVPIPERVGELFAALRAEWDDAPALAAQEAAWGAGRPFGRAFAESLAGWTAGSGLAILDPLAPEWLEVRHGFFAQALELAPQIVRALADVEARLAEAGFSPQVSRGAGDFPFFWIEDDRRSKISFDGSRFSVHGREERLTAAELSRRAREAGAVPSPAALLRPVLASRMMSVAATVLGPAELAYHAQTLPLFRLFGLTPPVLLPRPHLLPRGARERRAMEALGVSEEDLLRAREASPAPPAPAASAIAGLDAQVRARMAEISGALAALDPTLEDAAAGTVEKIGHQLSRLGEKAQRAAERRDAERTRRIELLETSFCPGGAPADRVYGALSYLLRFGDGVPGRLLDSAECSTEGARLVDFE